MLRHYFGHLIEVSIEHESKVLRLHTFSLADKARNIGENTVSFFRLQPMRESCRPSKMD